MIKYFIRILFAVVILLISNCLLAQDDLEELLEKETEERTEQAIATFKSTRVINMHSIERMQQGDLDFRVSHRFGELNSGAYEFFGLDHSGSHLSLEYGIFNWLMLGAGRATYQKTFDSFLKFSLIRQSSGEKNIPVSVSYYSGIAVNTLKFPESENDFFSSRLCYTHQILAARKCSNRLSLQLSPTLVHRNLVKTADEKNDLIAAGVGGRFKLSNRTAVSIEYFYVHDKNNDPGVTYYDPLSVGFDIETGSHVFQLYFTNATAIIEKGYIGETTGNWTDGDICFGFNISRVFTLK